MKKKKLYFGIDIFVGVFFDCTGVTVTSLNFQVVYLIKILD
jgi:hypothetical protein